MLRKMFGPNMEGKQENGEKCLVRSFIICTADQGRDVARMWQRRNLYRTLVGNSEGKRAPGRHTWRGENI